ncbi:MAG: alanine--glyoxylate aminotransferase family protein [bacterium]
MSNYTLFTPGPIDVPDEILKATSKSLVYHREQKFTSMFGEIADGLKKILLTKGRIFFFSASGTGAMEAACSNVLSSHDQPIVAICGRFGERWLEICKGYNTNPIVTRVDYGKSIEVSKIQEVLKKKNKPTVVFTTLTETSTGALNDIKTLGEVVRNHGSYFVVDGIAGIGADLCPQDDWHIDILVGASQKSLMSPPGVSFISINDRAFEKTKESDLPSYYFNLKIYEKFRVKNQTPWTPAINVLYGLKSALDSILKRGVEETLEHHKKLAEYIRERIGNMGLELLPEHPSNALTVMRVSKNNTTMLINELKEKHGILFADGQADLKGKIIRIGHMGNYDVSKMTRALDVLETLLNHWRIKNE